MYFYAVEASHLLTSGTNAKTFPAYQNIAVRRQRAEYNDLGEAAYLDATKRDGCLRCRLIISARSLGDMRYDNTRGI